MAFDIQRARPLLQTGNLSKLFVEELGWEHCRQKLTLRAGDADYAFTAIAEKRGFTAWLCACAPGNLPDHTTRLKLDRKLSETSFEHLIVFATRDYAQQSWVWVRREPGRPLSARTHEFNRAQPGDSLLQKLQHLYISIEDEERGDIHTLTVPGLARAAFDIERVTKAFYRDFDTHRKAFLKFIDGIDEVADREWYASVMLNRLMFVYFIQRKGFLDGDHAYLRNRLDRCQKEQGKDKFYTFYRYFLLRLFHEGFGRRRKDRAPDLEKLLGKIPYLNGGLFDVHELEKPDRYGRDIQIPDKAFECVFNFFDQWQWHLDERPLSNDNEINPNVLGYIFEKYINQKQMGAYYTQEDITEYISKNTVLPFLFNAARAKLKVAFENPSGPTVWDLLRENPDRYFFPAVKKGVATPLPKDIETGIKDVAKRGGWNKPAPAEYALPTEIWREVVARRQRYEEVKARLQGRARPPGALNSATSDGGPGGAALPITDINDFITLNLDLRQFAQDVIANCEGPDLLMAFWQAITTITVLDPTGGSGAFIFASLNVLESLYEACLDRMEAFLAEWNSGVGVSPARSAKQLHPNYHKKFTEVLSRVDAHPNRRYFVLKSIILNNLYAVDIMEEAVEICKLRLFLKLAAQVEPDAGKDNLGIEPLPDIDFNIRAGNSLVGYATYDEVKRAVMGGQQAAMDFDNAMAKIEDKAALLQSAFGMFRRQQTELGGEVTSTDKLELQKRLKALEDELNRHLAGQYGLKVSDKAAYAKWVKSHQPFHWFVQFYGILSDGGFDVIVGNPPYVEYSKVRSEYTIPSQQYRTESCSNLYPFIVERGYALLKPTGALGLILPLSAFCTQRMTPLITMAKERPGNKWIAQFGWRPSKLFEGVNIPLSILLTCPGNGRIFTTTFVKWYSEYRPALYQTLEFADSDGFLRFNHVIPKVGNTIDRSILSKVFAKRQTLADYSATGRILRATLYYRNTGGLYWRIITDFRPEFVLDGHTTGSSTESTIELRDKEILSLATGALNSNLFWFFYVVFSSFHHVNPCDILEFPVSFDEMSPSIKKRLGEASTCVMRDMKRNSELRQRIHKGGNTSKAQTFFPSRTKPYIDAVDCILAEHYGLSDGELDYVINYDIKYRMKSEEEE